MSDEFPEIPKPYYAGREYDFDQPEPGVDTNGGPFVLVNVEELEREIDGRYSRNIEALVDLQAGYRRSGNDFEVARLGGKIEGLKEQRSDDIAAIRRAAGVQR